MPVGRSGSRRCGPTSSTRSSRLIAPTELLRRCALAVLNAGTPTDDSRQVLETYKDFDIQVIQEDRGIAFHPCNLQEATAPNQGDHITDFGPTIGLHTGPDFPVSDAYLHDAEIISGWQKAGEF